MGGDGMGHGEREDVRSPHNLHGLCVRWSNTALHLHITLLSLVACVVSLCPHIARTSTPPLASAKSLIASSTPLRLRCRQAHCRSLPSGVTAVEQSWLRVNCG